MTKTHVLIEIEITYLTVASESKSKTAKLFVPESSIAAIVKEGEEYKVYLTADCTQGLKPGYPYISKVIATKLSEKSLEIL